MSKQTPAEKKAEAKRALSEMMQAETAPGKKQAEVVLAKTASKKTEQKPRTAPKKREASEAKAKPKSKARLAGEGKAQNMGLSLHPADQERIYAIEDAVRKAGIRERASTSLLIKIALAVFDPEKVENLPEVYQQLTAQDGRRKV